MEGTEGQVLREEFVRFCKLLFSKALREGVSEKCIWNTRETGAFIDWSSWG